MVTQCRWSHSWVLLILACALLAPPPAVATIVRHHHQKQYNSKYFSLHKTRPLMHMDLSDDGAIDEAFRRRAFENEIIVTCFTAQWVRWMVHYGRMAQALGFDHFMVLANEEDVCDIFQVAWCSDAETAGGDEGNRSTTACADSYPGCAWFTPERLPNAVGWSALKSGHNLETLWLLRYHLATEAMRRGINVLMSDLDVVIHGDFYRAVKAPPINEYQFLQMPGSDSPNGGLWYVQNAHPRGPIVNMFEEAVRIALLIVRLRGDTPFAAGDGDKLQWRCSWSDQDALEYTFVSAAHNGSRLDWWCIPEGVDAAAEWERAFKGTEGRPPRRYEIPPNEFMRRVPWRLLVDRKEKELWSVEELRANPYAEPAAWLSETCAGAEECARQDRYVRRQALFWPPMAVELYQLREMDPDPPPIAGDFRAAAAERAGPAPSVERALYSPMWLMHGAEVMARGWAAQRPQAWGLVTHLVAFGDSFGKEPGGRANRLHIIQALGLWHAPRPAPARVLRASRELARAAAAQPSDHGIRLLVRALMLLAAASGREPVLPSFPCGDAPWMRRDPLAMHGFYDSHFFTYLRDPKGPSEGDNVVCTPMMSMGDLCTDEVVLSDFHLDRDVLYPSYSHEALSLDGLDAASGATLPDAVSWARTALGSLGDPDARVLWLRGSPDAAARLGGAGTGDDGDAFVGAPGHALAGAEAAKLRALRHACPDYFETKALEFTAPPPPWPKPPPRSPPVPDDKQ